MDNENSSLLIVVFVLIVVCGFGTTGYRLAIQQFNGKYNSKQLK